MMSFMVFNLSDQTDFVCVYIIIPHETGVKQGDGGCCFIANLLLALRYEAAPPSPCFTPASPRLAFAHMI